MKKTRTISGGDFVRMVIVGAARLNNNRKSINDLNVFPIPDGDTGDNMYMTIEAGCRAAAGHEASPLCEVASVISKGMLLGARGNSGVILSRIFAGIAKGLENVKEADPEAFRKAMESGVTESYGAVANPVEGTILTVIRESVETANALGDIDFEYYFSTLLQASEDSLEHTPKKLAVLKSAGVVDSGGAGLVCIIKGMKEALEGAEASLLEGTVAQAQAPNVDLDSFGPDSELEFGYCTEFLLRLQNSKVEMDSFDEKEIFDYLNSVGESVVAFRDGSIIKVHVHSKTPGDILSHCQKWGEFLTVKVENMTLQHHENHMEEKLFSRTRKRCAVVTVASGEGLAATLKDAGADIIIEGGQTMNPSSEDFIKAFKEVCAEKIYVLPNNPNIILAATQAAQLYKESEVIVIPTKSFGEGYAVAGCADWSLSDDEIMENAESAVRSIATGMVSQAIRDCQEASKGEFIGFHDKAILSHSLSRTEALTGLCDALGADGKDVIIVFKGEDVTEDEAEAACKELERKYPCAEVILQNGGQAVYDYITILE